jgi:hypothetical protein
MKTLTKRVWAIAGVLALGFTAAKAQTDSALIDALVKKGVLSDREAEDIRASAEKEYGTTAASKLSISDSVTKLKLYGDARYRYEYLDEKPENSLLAASTGLGNYANTTNRYRYRIRVGADYTFTDNFKAGVELESSNANDSANQSFGNAYSKYSINVGLLYLQYKPVDWLTLTGGLQRNPLYTTNLVWDPDINPAGGSEVASWTFPVDFGSDATPASKDPKDVKAITAPAGSDMSFSIGITAFQGIYADNSENAATPLSTPTTGTGLADRTDVWQFVEQVPIQFNFNKDTFIKEVPGFDSYMGGGNNNLTGSIGGPNSTAGGSVLGGDGALAFAGPHAADHLQIFTAPGEVDWKLWNIPFKVYWDFALNTEGKARIQDVYLGNNGGLTNGGAITPTLLANNRLAQTQNADLGDNVAWLAGLQVGQNKKKGDWSVRGDFRQVGLGAIDPNLNDSDWGDSFLNQQGVQLTSTYNFTDFLTGSLTYFNTWDYKNDLLNGVDGQSTSQLPITTQVQSGTTPATASLAGASRTQRVEADIMWKF